MSDWATVAMLPIMGWTGFVIGVQYTFGRKRLHPFLWGITHPTGPPQPWTPHDKYGKPWDLDETDE